MFIDIRTDYCLLNSLIKIESLVELAVEKQWKYLGTADDSAGGLLEFYLECKANNIKPILGLRFRVTNHIEHTTDSQIILYAQNLAGYHNLLKLSSKAAIDGYKNDEANLTVDWLETKLGEDLLCVLPIGESPNELCNELGADVVKRLQKVFKGKLFYGLYNRDCAIDDIFLRKAEAKGTPYLFLSNAKYTKVDERLAFKVLRAINEKSTLERLFETVWLDESIETSEKRYANYKHTDYMDKFMGMIDLDIPCPGLKVPKFPVPKDFATSYDYMVHLCREGYKAKLEEFDTPEKRDACKKRMAVELDVIKRCELSDYFLLVYDICKYCDSSRIPRGISRGSAGGSLVAFLTDISRTNPLTYGLLFERFLNEERTRPLVFNGETYLTGAPDIDLDIGQIQRQQVIEFLRTKYGFVAKIATYTTLTAKACIKDTIRAFGRYENEAGRIASYIEVKFGKADSLSKTYEKHAEFRQWADQNKQIYNCALYLEDVKKNASVHPAGLLISDQDISNRAPMFLANSTGDEFKQDACIAYSLDLAEKAGLLKVDILGIRTLCSLSDAIDLINAG